MIKLKEILNEKKGFESKDGKAAIKQYKKIYEKQIKNGERYFASSIDNLADFMEEQGLKNQAELLRGEYLMEVYRWKKEWLGKFVKSLK